MWGRFQIRLQAMIFFILPNACRFVRRLTQPPIQKIAEILSSGTKEAEHDAYHSHPSAVQNTNA